MIPDRESRVLFVQYAHPGGYPPVLNASRILQSAGWSVSMLGIRFPGQTGFDVPSESARSVELVRAPVPRYLLRFFFGWFCWRVRRMIHSFRPNWLYVSDPMACVAAIKGLGAAPKCHLLYHEHDLMDLCTQPGKGSWKQRLITNDRRELASRAEICVVPNRNRAITLQQQTGRRGQVDVVWNCPSRNELDCVAGTADYRTNADQPFHVIYCGSLNEVRVPFTYIDALTSEPRARLTLIGYETNGSLGFSEKIRRYASERHVADRLTLGDPVSRAGVFLALQRAHVAIATVPLRSDDGNMSGMLGASNKSFDGLCVGIPVLVSDLPDWREEFVDRGVALACDPGDPRSIANAWRRLADQPDQTRAMGERGRALIASEWNYESQFRSVLESMNGTKLAPNVGL